MFTKLGKSGLLLGLVLCCYTLFAGCSLASGLGGHALDYAEQAKIIKAEVTAETVKLLDTDGDGKPDIKERIQEVEYKAGEAAEAAASGIPYGELFLTGFTTLLSALGITKATKIVREKIINPKVDV